MTWSNFLNLDSTVKSQVEIEQIMSEAGIEKSDQIVTYCTSGIRSAHNALVLRMAGYEKAKNYDGSINEWGAIDELPME
jgi:thiosulfate/3-mercaptopyruvate sulfurtransferase